MIFRIPFLIVLLPFLTSAQVDTSLHHLNVKGRITLDGNYQSGNLEQRMVRITLAPAFEIRQFKIAPFLQYSYGRIFANELQNDIFAYIVADYPKRGHVYLNMSAMIETSKLRSIKERWVAGPGVGLRLLASKFNTLDVVHSVVRNQTRFAFNSHRNYNLLSYALAIRGRHTASVTNAELTYTVFWQTRPADSVDDDRIRALIVVSLPIAKRISFSLTTDYIFEVIVDEARKSSNLIGLVGLAVKM